jgi:uncharacterized repeat protein (TIGR01451 family)
MKFFINAALLGLLLCATSAWAQPKIEIALKAEVEVKEVVDGKEVVLMAPAKEVMTGQVIHYTLTCSNIGDQAATAVKVNDPIPKEVVFQVGSAFGDNSEVTFSIDGGKNYKLPTLLSYKIRTSDGSFEERLASPDEYTHIQWQIASIPAKATVNVGFRATVR